MPLQPFTFEQLLRLRATYFFQEASESYRAAVRNNSAQNAVYGELTQRAFSRRNSVEEGLWALVQSRLYLGEAWDSIVQSLPGGVQLDESRVTNHLKSLLEGYLYPHRNAAAFGPRTANVTPEGFRDAIRILGDLDAWLGGGREEEEFFSTNDYSVELRDGLLPGPRDLRSKAIGTTSYGAAFLATDFETFADRREALAQAVFETKNVAVNRIDRLEPASMVAVAALVAAAATLLRAIEDGSARGLDGSAVKSLRIAVRPEATVDELRKAAGNFVRSSNGPDLDPEVAMQKGAFSRLLLDSEFAEGRHFDELWDSDQTVGEVLKLAPSRDAVFDQLGEIATVRLLLASQNARASDAARQAAIRASDPIKDHVAIAGTALIEADRAIDAALVADFFYSRDVEAINFALCLEAKDEGRTLERLEALKGNAKKGFFFADLKRNHPHLNPPEVPEEFSDPAAVIRRLDEWVNRSAERTVWSGQRTKTLVSDGMRPSRADLISDRSKLSAWAEAQARTHTLPEGVNFYQAQQAIQAVETDRNSLESGQRDGLLMDL